jgi:HAMP domain-containing protein
MANLLWVAGAVVFSTLLILVIWLRNRKPSSGIEEFNRELRALAPDTRSPAGRPVPGRGDRSG